MTRKQPVHVAALSTRHFSFTAIGRTEGEAVRALWAGWYAHAEQTGATATRDEMADDVHVQEFRAGQCVRYGDDRPISDLYSGSTKA